MICSSKIFSKLFANAEVIDIGQYLFGSSATPLLKIGVTWACFICCGKDP